MNNKFYILNEHKIINELFGFGAETKDDEFFGRMKWNKYMECFITKKTILSKYVYLKGKSVEKYKKIFKIAESKQNEIKKGISEALTKLANKLKQEVNVSLLFIVFTSDKSFYVVFMGYLRPISYIKIHFNNKIKPTQIDVVDHIND